MILPIFISMMMVMGGFFAQSTIAQDSPSGTPTTEVLEPTAEPTVVETATPSPTELPATETPTTEPTATETPVATETVPPVEETPAVEAELDPPVGLAPMSAVPDGSLLYNCAQSSETVAPGGSFTVSCLMDGSSLYNYGRVLRPSLASTNPNFIVGIVVTTQAGSTLSSLASGNSSANTQFSYPDSNAVRVTFTIYATSAAVPGFQFDATFEVCAAWAPGLLCGWLSAAGDVNITATVAGSNLVEGTHFTLACTPTTVAPTLNQSLESTCTLIALTAIGSNQLRLVNIITTLTPNPAPGWTVAIVPSTGVLSGTMPGTHVPSPLPDLTADGTYVFKVRFTPTACSAASSAPSVGVSVSLIRLVNSSPSGANVTSGVKTVSATFSPPAVSQTAQITAAPVPVSVPYNMTSAQTGTASFTARYTVSGCATWNGYAAMGPFVNADSLSSGPVPVLTSASHGLTVVSPTGSTVETKPIATISNTATHLLAGSAPGVVTTIDHTINLSYVIPANTPVGTYQSTITVSTTNAP